MAAFKKQVTIIGIGPRRVGVGKSGPYDFAEVSISVPHKNWDGGKAVSGRISGEAIDTFCLVPGSSCCALLYFAHYEYELIDIIG